MRSHRQRTPEQERQRQAIFVDSMETLAIGMYDRQKRAGCTERLGKLFLSMRKFTPVHEIAFKATVSL